MQQNELTVVQMKFYHGAYLFRYEEWQQLSGAAPEGGSLEYQFFSISAVKENTAEISRSEECCQLCFYVFMRRANFNVRLQWDRVEY